jgi:hypothetical protein
LLLANQEIYGLYNSFPSHTDESGAGKLRGTPMKLSHSHTDKAGACKTLRGAPR